MPAVVSIDGVLAAPEASAIPVLDRGFLYGDSAFEVLRTYGKRPFAMGPHLARLELSCAKIGIPAPDLDRVRAEIATALSAGDNEESYVRVVITRGITAIGLAVAEEVRARRVIVVLPLAPQPEGVYENGIEVTTTAIARSLDGTGAAGAKASNYLPNILSLESARRTGASEAISVGSNGELLEGTTSNLFLVKEGRVSTPPLGVGILEGITRRVVMEAARAEGIDAAERLLFPPALYGADEAFITSTLREMIPVVRADGVPIGTGRPGPMTLALHQAFRRRVAELLDAER